ncbi:MAG: hypothetical protein KGJ34_00730 [Patescibacteria group bacterium]|nr:hypothetical protein [Patescibacteria group bacterium]
MDPQAQASFIPKKPLVASAMRPAPHAGLLWFISILIFFASLIAAGGAFAYEQYLAGAIQSESTSLQEAQAAYDPTVIGDIIRLDSRINAAETLLANHLAPSSIFTFLENNTLQNVSFTGFEYDINPDGSATLTLSGEALDFSSVALQSDTFGQSQALKDVLFSDINVDPGTGHIVFKVSATVDPSLILYRNALSTLSVASSSTSNASTTTSASTLIISPTSSASSSQSSYQSGQPFGTTP